MSKMYLKILYKLRCLGCILKQDKRCAVKNTWSKSSKSIFLTESFSFSTKTKLSILLNFPFLTASLVHFSSYHAKKKRCRVSTGDGSPAFMRKNRHTKFLVRAPSRRVGSTTGPLRHSRLETEPKHHGDRPFANPVGRSPERFAQEGDSLRLWGKVLQQIPCQSRG